MPAGNYEYLILEMINNAFRSNQARGLLLGGIRGSGGGTGGPPGGFVGYLPQNRVAYDLSELATDSTVGSGSLVDNLNHIRYRIGELEAVSGLIGTGGHTITDDTTTYAQRTNLQFLGGVVVSDDVGTDSTVISITAGSGGGSGHIIQDNGSNMTPRTNLNFVGSGVVLTDDSGNDATVVTINGGGGPGGGLPWFNVKDYGATGDGTTDDTSSIGLAIDALNATISGGVLYFPAGIYYTTGYYTLTKPANVFGDGGGVNGQGYGTYGEVTGSTNAVTTIIVNDYYMFDTTAEVLSVHDLCVRVEQNTSPYVDGVIAWYDDTLFQKIDIYNCTFIGFESIVYGYYGQDCRIHNNIFHGRNSSILDLREVSNLYIYDNTFVCESACTGIEITWYSYGNGKPYVLINNNIFYSINPTNEWQQWEAPIYMNVPPDREGSFIITNNIIRDAGYYGIEIDSGDTTGIYDIIVTGNEIHCNMGTNYLGHSVWGGIYLGYAYSVTNKGSLGAIIDNNVIYNNGVDSGNGEAAITCYYAKNIYVGNNTTFDFPTPYSVSNCENVRIETYQGYRTASAPGTSNDINNGWRAGDYWIDSSDSNALYVCLDDTAGAAVWGSVAYT